MLKTCIAVYLKDIKKRNLSLEEFKEKICSEYLIADEIFLQKIEGVIFSPENLEGVVLFVEKEKGHRSKILDLYEVETFRVIYAKEKLKAFGIVQEGIFEEVENPYTEIEVLDYDNLESGELIPATLFVLGQLLQERKSVTICDIDDNKYAVTYIKDGKVYLEDGGLIDLSLGYYIFE